MPIETDEQILRYLLDEMNEEERSTLDEQLSREPFFFEVISAAEDDMIMKYVCGDLDRRLLTRFTEIYLNSPSKRVRVEEARIWQQAVHETARSREATASSRLRHPKKWKRRISLFSAAAVLIMLAVVLSLWKNHPSLQQVALQNTAPLRFSLTSGLVRGSTGVEITLPPGTRRVQFELTLSESVHSDNNRIVLKTIERSEVWTGSAVRSGPIVIVIIPANVLEAGDYTLELHAQDTSIGNEEGSAVYYFRVMK